MRSKKKTIGVLIGQIGDRYHSQMWPSLIDVAQKFNVGLVLFIGQSVNDPVDFKTQENAVYSYIDRGNLDGLIVFASVGNYLSDEEFKRFLDRYKGIPTIVVSRKIEGYPSVTVENYDGMYDIVEHMIRAHGRKRIAFIRGMSKNPEAEKRYQAYLDAQKNNGIPFDEQLVADGTFAGPTGADAVKELLDKRKAKFDCLVAANDDMLLWAKRVLDERRIRIPEDISIGGFDNLPETLFSEPPITTVEQPLSLLSFRAGEILVGMMNGETTGEPDSTVAARMVIRKSCGCFAKADPRSLEIHPESGADAKDTEVLERLEKKIEEVSGEIMNVLQGSDYPQDVLDKYVRELMRTFFAQIRAPEREDPMDPVIERIINAEKIRYVTDFWIGAVNIMQDILLRHIGEHRSLVTKARGIFKSWQYTVTQMGIRSFNNERNTFWSMQWSMLSLTQALSTAFEVEKIRTVLSSRQLAEFELYACNVVLYERAGINIPDLGKLPSEQSRLIFAYNRNKATPESYYSGVFPTCDLAPFDMFENDDIDAWGIFPLIFEDLHFGYMSFELHKYNYYNYIIPNTLRENISSSLKGAYLIRELKNTQEQLTEAAKIAREANYHKSKVIVNMSHELRTPLNSINGITELLKVGGYEKSEEILQDVRMMLKYVEETRQTLKSSPGLLDMLSRYKDILEKGGNTKPFVFACLKEIVRREDGDNHPALMELLEDVIKNLDNEYEETQQAFKHIKEAGVYLLGLIDMVLNLSKVETGKLDVFRTKVNIRAFIESVVQDSVSYARSVKKEGLIELKYEVGKDVPDTCLLDKQKLKEVLLNLLTNAIKYTEKGGVFLRVCYDGANIRFEVEDNGIGISEEERSKIFTEFGRTDDARSIEGTGLGLVFSKRLVEIQGGQIGFDSRHGIGSTFWFTIPVTNK